NQEPRLRSQHCQESLQVIARERHASRRRRPIRSRHMNDDGAAPTRHARARVMVDLDDEIVEVIVPPEAVAAVIGRALERTVVAAIGGIFTPSKGRINASGRQQCRRVRMAIRAPPQADEAKAAARCRAITLEFVGAKSAAAEHDLQAAKAGQIDLVIMDVGLPDVDGREDVRILRKNGFKAPIIMLTGHNTDSDTILGLESGANDYVTKPFRFAVLLARIRAQLRQYE